MSVEVDKLFEMLNWNNEEGIQKKGIEEGLNYGMDKVRNTR